MTFYSRNGVSALSLAAVCALVFAVAVARDFNHSDCCDGDKDGHSRRDTAYYSARSRTGDSCGKGKVSVDGLVENSTFAAVANESEYGSKKGWSSVTLCPQQSVLQEVSDGEAKATAEERSAENERLGNEIRSLFSLIPVKLPDSMSVKNELCRNHTRVLFRELENFEIWAMRMFDASAKPPSGLLNGNVNQLGDFDQCLGVSADVDRSRYELEDYHISGKYCLAMMDMELGPEGKTPFSKSLHTAVNSLQAYYMINSKLDDPGHRLPRFSTIHWAFCIPSSCSERDLEDALLEALRPYNETSALKLRIAVDPQLCHVKEAPRMSRGTKYTLAFFLSIIGLVVLGSGLDFVISDQSNWKKTNTPLRMCLAFSLKKNYKKLMDTEANPDEMPYIHGFRFLNALGLLVSHKAMAMYYLPYSNRTDMALHLTSGAWTSILRSAILYTDSFIFLSGLLTSYNFTKELDKKKKINIFSKYFNRYVRLTPNLLAVILFCTYLTNHLGTGPQWNVVVKQYSDLCQKYMWRNLLYVHNYYGFENMCLTHTHQLGIDMQQFLVAPFLVYILWRWPKRGFWLLATLSTFSTILRYSIVQKMELSNFIHFGVKVRQLFDTANFSYILPTHRATTYLFGLAMGYILRRIPEGLKLSRPQAWTGWIIATFLGVSTGFGMGYMAEPGYKYNTLDAAIYSAFTPISWSIFLSWGFIAVYTGSGGMLTDFLCWKGWAVFTRISYAVYLTQFPIYFFNVGTTRSSHYYSTMSIVFNFVEYIAVIIASVTLTLLIDMPFQELKNVLTKKAPAKESQHPEGASEREDDPSRAKAVEDNSPQRNRNLMNGFSNGELRKRTVA